MMVIIMTFTFTGTDDNQPVDIEDIDDSFDDSFDDHHDALPASVQFAYLETVALYAAFGSSQLPATA